MTQPVQEPLTQRSISQLTWGQNQLYRRPSPASGDDRPWARVSKPFVDGTFYPNQVVSNNNNTTIDFDESYNMDVGDSGADFFNELGSPINGITFLVQGLYTITAELLWNEALSFPFYVALSGDGMDWAHQVPGYMDSLGGAPDTGQMITMTHRYEAGDQIQFAVYQRSGGNRTILAAYLEAVYMGSWSGIAFNDILPRE